MCEPLGAYHSVERRKVWKRVHHIPSLLLLLEQFIPLLLIRLRFFKHCVRLPHLRCVVLVNFREGLLLFATEVTPFGGALIPTTPAVKRWR